MRRHSRVPPLIAAFCVGLVCGLYVQHAWPIGRLLAPKRATPIPAVATIEELARLVPSERLVIVAAGQSNAANHGGSRASGGAGVYAFADGKIYQAIDPLPGAGGDGGSIWTRFGARLVATGRRKAVILASIAQGSTRIDDWTTGGWCHERLLETLQQLRQANVPADFVLWQQGETEAWSVGDSGRHYASRLRDVIASCRAASPKTRFVVAQSTVGAPVRNAQIRTVQGLATELGAVRGPDIDQLGAEFRSDGAHLNERGLEAAADLWVRALDPML